MTLNNMNVNLLRKDEDGERAYKQGRGEGEARAHVRRTIQYNSL